MRELLTVGGVALTIFSLIAAGVAAMFYANVKALRDTAEDLRGRVGDLEDERDNLKRGLSQETRLHQATRRDLDALGRVVTGEAHWVAIEELLHSQHDASMSQLGRILAALHEGQE